MMIKKYFARQALATLLLLATAVGALAQTPSVTGTITTQNLVPAGTATPGSCVAIEVNNKGVATVQVTGTYTGALSGQVTINETTWTTLAPTPFIPATALGTPAATIASGSTGIWEVAGIAGKQVLRVCALAAVTGTATVTLNTSPATPASLATISGGAGDASASNQVAGNASLSSIDTKTPALGQALAAGSSPVVLPALQNAVNTQGSTTSGQSGALIQGAVTTAAPTYTTGQTSPLSLDTSGQLRITGTVSAGGVAQGSTTSGQTGGLIQAAVTTAAPTYTTGQTSPLSLDTSGQLRITGTVSAGGVAQGSTTSGQTGGLIQGAVTTSAPTYTTAQTSPLSLRTTGALRIGGDSGAFASGAFASGALASGSVASGAFASGSIASGAIVDGADVATGTTTDAAATAGGTGTVSAKLRRISTQIPAAVGATTMSASMPVTIATDDARIGIVTETAPASDTASSGLNGRLQRIAQNLTTVNTSINTASNYEATKDSAVPTRLVAMGARIGANADAVAQGAITAAINVSSATTTQLVALSGSTKIYVTGLAVIAGGTGNITLAYGTGTNCGTGTTSLSGAIPLVANAGFTLGSGLGAVLVVPAGQALCITTSAAVQMSGFVTYAQF